MPVKTFFPCKHQDPWPVTSQTKLFSAKLKNNSSNLEFVYLFPPLSLKTLSKKGKKNIQIYSLVKDQTGQK